MRELVKLPSVSVCWESEYSHQFYHNRALVVHRNSLYEPKKIIICCAAAALVLVEVLPRAGQSLPQLSLTTRLLVPTLNPCIMCGYYEVSGWH